MKVIIYRSEITKDRWQDTSILRTDGKEEFREIPKFGNRHAVFEKDSSIGYIHEDEHNGSVSLSVVLSLLPVGCFSIICFFRMIGGEVFV